MDSLLTKCDEHIEDIILWLGSFSTNSTNALIEIILHSCNDHEEVRCLEDSIKDENFQL